MQNDVPWPILLPLSIINYVLLVHKEWFVFPSTYSCIYLRSAMNAYAPFAQNFLNHMPPCGIGSQWKSERAIMLRVQCFLIKDSVLNTSAITAVTKSSMKPWSSATTNCHLREWRKEWRTKVSFGRTVIRALELERLAKRYISGRSNVEVKPIALTVIELRLSEGISQI